MSDSSPAPTTTTSESLHTHALDSQVGGHPGVQASDDGSLIIKPSLPLEKQFYETVASDPIHQKGLRKHIPKFFGTLKLEGKVNDIEKGLEGGVSVSVSTSSSEKESVVLENLSAPFKYPNILDIKLGTVLYDADPSAHTTEEKVARMEKTAKATTTWETGIRLTGFQVYDTTAHQPITTPKSYGKSITSSQLPQGISKFFPSSSLSQPILLSLLQHIHSKIASIRSVMANTEMRMVGGSLLIIYEADEGRVKEGLLHVDEEGSDMGEEDEEEDEEEDADAEGEEVVPPKAFTVKLIDFAHTHFVPGQGPDEGVLKGFDTVLSLLEGRIKEVESG